MERMPTNEDGKGQDMPETITVGELARYLSEHPEAQQEILGGVFSEEETAGKMTSEVILKTMEKIGLHPLSSPEEVEKLLAERPTVPLMQWNEEEKTFEEYDPNAPWDAGNRIFSRD